MAESVGDSSLNLPFKDLKLFWPKNQGIAHMNVTKLTPLVLTEVGHLCKPALFALQFDNAAALGQLGTVVALLGDVSLGPQPEGAVNLYTMNITSIIQKGKYTMVALRMSTA